VDGNSRRRRFRTVAAVVIGGAIGVCAVAGLGVWWFGRGIGPVILPSRPLLPETSAKGALPLDAAGGLKVRVFAKDLDGPRVMLFDYRGTLLVSERDAGRVTALRDDNQDGVADSRKVLAGNLNVPHGLTFRPGAMPAELYVAETDKVSRYIYDPLKVTLSDPVKIVDLPSGGGHVTRTARFDSKGRLYITVGSSMNVGVESDKHRAAMLVCDADGKNLRVYAKGLRNTVFFIFDRQERIWGNDMGRDLLGDDTPPDELNIITDGGDYGWPYCYGDRVPDPFGGTRRI
jgi:glucose/arabinose dehydrogenase